MSLKDHLLGIERELSSGSGDAYRRHLTEDALVIVPPGHTLDREKTVATMDESPGWDEVALDNARLLTLDDHAALITYTFTGRRGEDRYAAVMTSTYARRGDDWKLVLHQQTPLDG